MVWGSEPPDPAQLDNGQWYQPHGERYFLEITEEEAVPPGVDRGTYIDPEWHWFWKVLKKLAPHDIKVGLGMYALCMALVGPSLYRWATEDIPQIGDVDDEDDPRLNKFNFSMEDARRMLGDTRSGRRQTSGK